VFEAMWPILQLDERAVWCQLQSLRRLYITAEVSYSHQKTTIPLYTLESPVKAGKHQFNIRKHLERTATVPTDGMVSKLEVFVQYEDGRRHLVPYTRVKPNKALTIDSEISVDIGIVGEAANC